MPTRAEPDGGNLICHTYSFLSLSSAAINGADIKGTGWNDGRSGPRRKPAAVAGVVRQSRQPRHDRALHRALSQLWPEPRRAAVRTGRSSASPRPAATWRRATGTISSSPSGSSEGIRDAGGIPLEFPTHPIQETGKRPTAGLDRNLAYLGLVEVLYGYPLDGVVLTIGCDKTTPACLMAAATVNIPAIALSVGPMLNGHFRGRADRLGHDRLEGARNARRGRDRL